MRATTSSGQKTREKNGRSEERPSSGRKRPGRAAASQSKIAIPRCNNMLEITFAGKRENTLCETLPCGNRAKIPQFLESTPGLALLRHFVQRKISGIRMVRRALGARERRVTPLSRPGNKRVARSSYLAPRTRLGDASWPRLRGLRMPWTPACQERNPPPPPFP